MGRICEKVGFKIREWKIEGVMDGENGESAEGGEVRGPAKDEPERERERKIVGLIGCRRYTRSCFQRQGEAYRKERSVTRNEDN